MVDFCFSYTTLATKCYFIFRLGDEQTLQQFSRDADEMENWIAEKLQLATEESYKVCILA